MKDRKKPHQGLRELTDAETRQVSGGRPTLHGPGQSEPQGEPQSDNFFYVNKKGDRIGKPYP
jgi:hypothetical protein